MHIGIDVYSKGIKEKSFQKTTHCIIVFVAIDDEGGKVAVPKWIPTSDREKQLEEYAIKLMSLRKNIEDEMKPYLE